MRNTFRIFIEILLCFLSLIICISCQSDTADNNKNPFAFNKISVDQIKNYDNQHLVISYDSENTMGFIPDTASKYRIKTNQQRNVDIQGETIPTLLLKRKENKFTIEYTIDNNKESERHFRLMVFNNEGIIPFKIHGRKFNYYDVTMKKESSKMMQLDFFLDKVAEMSDLIIINIDKDFRHYYVDQLGAIRILATAQSNWLNKQIRLPATDKAQYVKTDSKKSNNGSEIVLLSKNKIQIKQGQNKKASYIMVVPLNGVKCEQIFLFDMNGHVVPFGNKKSLTIASKPHQAAVIPVPKNIDFNTKRYFLLTIENPKGAAFQNIKSLKKGMDKYYRNFTYYYDLY